MSKAQDLIALSINANGPIAAPYDYYLDVDLQSRGHVRVDRGEYVEFRGDGWIVQLMRHGDYMVQRGV